MKKLIEGFTRQLEDALRISGAINLTRPGSDIRNVLIAGMGSSGLTAELVESLTYARIPIPIAICRNYNIPQFVSPHTLFIACSYNGNTEEVMAAVQKATLKRAHIICITSGGRLLEFARANNLLFIQLPFQHGSPRAMIGYMLVSLMTALYHTNLIGATYIKETENAIAFIDGQEEAIRQEAARLGRQLKGRLTVIYSDTLLHAMALRFQQQLNENAKQLAHVGTFPEVNYNEVEGWRFPEPVLALAQVVYLHSDHDHERVQKRLELSREIFEKRSVKVIDMTSQGASLLEQYFYLIHLTDWITYFVALENQVDPDAEDTIDFLKSELSRS
ncbi:MAG: bifunctional phosphoglucose/phosphomannose isomerase [Cyclobacteriaceae bacterium]|nr:bifunctional phosphoglucose/phosphomannose isomerase [Cyclobacteriaceae bacterium]